MSRLLATFGAEAEERIQAMNRDLLMLEGTTEADTIGQRLEALFREAHSLKGAARAVSVERVELLAHRLESLFELMRSGELAPEATVCDVIYRALDALGLLVREATTDAAANVDVESLMAMLEDPRRGVLEPEPPPPPAPAEVEPPPAWSAAPGPGPPPPPPRASGAEPVAPPSAPAAAAPPPASDTVRIATAKLDALLVEVGELAVAEAGVDRHLARLRAVADNLETWEATWRKRRASRGRQGSKRPAVAAAGPDEDDWNRLRAARSQIVEVHRLLRSAGQRVAEVTADLEDEVRRSRMLPVSAMFDAFPRMVRDIARGHDKQVALVIAGADTEVDRSLLEQLRAPLTHVVRNSVDHGIEDPDMRLAGGKRPQGTITIRAHQHGGTLSLEVADDGAGIDVARVRAKAVERGLVTAEAAERLGDSEAIGLIYRSGFSTAPIITDLSGRGVGLDVVRESIERLHGMIDVDSTSGQGTRFTFVLPLSVSTTPCLLVAAAGQTFALPVTNVSRIIRMAADAVEYLEGSAVIRDEGSIVALADLGDVLGINRAAGHQAEDPTPAILLGSADRRVAFLVDSLIDLQNLVTKALPPPLLRVRHLSGATMLGTGEAVGILNVANLIRSAVPRQQADEPEPADAPTAPTVVLLVEDSITTRTLEKNILEAAGYEVRAVGDGTEAWNVLQEGGIDAVVSDVYMAGLDGFELTARLRSDERLRHLPVVLVTSKDSRSHRLRGVEVGADAYIVKGSFEQQNLVDAVARLV
jgi:two-component system chemotaxis sensor kinase CheA